MFYRSYTRWFGGVKRCTLDQPMFHCGRAPLSRFVMLSSSGPFAERLSTRYSDWRTNTSFAHVNLERLRAIVSVLQPIHNYLPHMLQVMYYSLSSFCAQSLEETYLRVVATCVLDFPAMKTIRMARPPYRRRKWFASRIKWRGWHSCTIPSLLH